MPVNGELHEMRATTLVEGFRRRTLSPLDVARAIIERIERCDGAINAFCHRDAEATLASARESERRWQVGQPLGPLDGVPVSVKDLIHVRGWPTRHGSRATPDAGPWNFDSPAVARLREGGAVLIGKTTTPEFGHKGVTESGLTGRTSNPWNLAMNPGGSSGGAGAALAAGMGPLALGTDGGGSCRKPASYCGVVGMKPTQGSVPAWPPSALWPLSSTGPMARSAEDCALLLDSIARPDPRDPYASSAHRTHSFAASADPSLKGLRLAFAPELGGSTARTEVARAVMSTMAAFRELGAEVVEAGPRIADPMPLYRVLLNSGWLNVVRPMSPEQRAKLDPSFQEAVARSAKITADDVRHALEVRLRLGAELATFHETHDILVTPTNPVTAYAHGSREPVREPEDRFSATVCFTFPFNITGQPAISVPCGTSAAGLPIGLQIVGPIGSDLRVLWVAQAFERVSGWQGRLAPL